MKILAVLGSTRENSRSYKVANKILSMAKENGCQIKTYDINKINFNGCLGCGACRNNSIDCIQEDGLKEYWQDLHSCDVLLLTASNYYSQVCGQMIMYMNRHYCMSNKDKATRIESGKKLIAVFAQGAPENYPKYLPNYDWYLNTFTSKGIELVDRIIVGGDSDLSENGKIMTNAKNIASKLK